MSEILGPQRTGKKAVVTMKIDVLVEVEESDDFYDMVDQAHERLTRHILPSKGFFPFRKEVDIVQDSTTVDELVSKLTVAPGSGWFDR